MNDLALVRRAQIGDALAADALVRRYTRHAHYLASRYYLPGGDQDDVQQEALCGILAAIRSYRPEHEVPFGAFADLCIRRWLKTAVTFANRQKHRHLNEALSGDITLDDGDTFTLIDLMLDRNSDPAIIVEQREEIRRLARVLRDDLSPLERHCIIGLATGHSYQQLGAKKAVDNALQRARGKLAA